MSIMESMLCVKKNRGKLVDVMAIIHIWETGPTLEKNIYIFSIMQ
jgi:hypothetical protein